MRKERAGANEEKVIAYMSSRLYPWNFIIEKVDEESLKHYAPYAIQICEDRGIKRGMMDKVGAKGVIEKEVKRILNDYLHGTDKEAMRLHGQFYGDYPFAFAQTLIYAILHRLGLSLDDMVNLKALGELLDLDMKELKRRERFIFDLIARTEEKALRVFGKTLLDRKVISEKGDYIGTVIDVLFDSKTGIIEWLLLNQHSERVKVPMNDMKLNLYSRNIVLKYDKKEQ